MEGTLLGESDFNIDGIFVGKLLCVPEFNLVGIVVGILLGASDFNIDGIFVGKLLGVPDFNLVGNVVGILLGEPDFNIDGIFFGKLLGESDFNIERTVVGMLLGLSDLKTVGIPVGAFVFTKGTGAELINEFDLKFSVSSFNNSAVSILCISVCRLTFISDRKILSISD